MFTDSLGNGGEVRVAKVTDIQRIEELDRMVFDENWVTEPGFGESMYNKNSKMYRVVEDEGVVKGYYLLVPLEKMDFGRVLKGEIKENELVDVVQCYEKGRYYDMYMGSIVVDKESECRSTYTKLLLKDLKNQLIEMKDQGIDLGDFGGITVSDDGERISARMGKVHVGDVLEYGEVYKVFRASCEDVIENIEI